MKLVINPLISIIIFCSFNSYKISAQDEVGFFCYGNETDNLPTYQTYANNVHSLISLLASKSSSTPGIFYSTSMGEGGPRAYGSYLCRGDLESRLCQRCVSDVATFISQTNITNSECYGRAVYHKGLHCIVHHANRSIFSVYEEGRWLYSDSIGKNVEDYQSYNETLSRALQGLIKEATFGTWTQRNFETRVAEVNGSGDDKIYLLVQCTPDISAMNCSKCLGELYSRIPKCCNGTEGGYVAYGNCLMKYNNQPFFGRAYHNVLPNFWHMTLVLTLTMYLAFK